MITRQNILIGRKFHPAAFEFIAVSFLKSVNVLMRQDICLTDNDCADGLCARRPVTACVAQCKISVNFVSTYARDCRDVFF